MRLIAIGAGLLLLVAAALFAVVLWLVDPETLGPLLETEIERATGAQATLGNVDFSLFPLPALDVSDIELREPPHERREPGRREPILTARAVRVRVSLMSALMGRVVLTGLDLEEPHVRLALDEEGRPVLPLAQGDGDESAEPVESGAPALAIHRIRISQGTVELGPWKLENIFLAGALGVDLAANFKGELDVAGVGRLTDQAVRVTGLLSDTVEIEASGRLEQVDLQELARRIGLQAEVASVEKGALSGRFDVSLVGDELRSLDLDLLARGLEASASGVRIAGDVPARAEAGGRWTLDLTPARVEMEGVLAKPAGAELAVSGTARGASAPLEDLKLLAAGNELPLRIGDDGTLHAGPATLELGPLAEWLVADVAVKGQLAITSFAARPEPLTLDGKGSLASVELVLPHGSVSLAGAWTAAGTKISAPALAIGVGGQSFAAETSYDVARGTLDVRGATDEAQVEPVLQALRGSAELTGTLALDARVEGPPDPEKLTGQGVFKLSDGEIRGFSILEQVLGELARFPILLATLKGKDLSKYDEERFESLEASFTLRDGRMHVRPLVAVYRSGTATLTGSINLADGGLDLRGRVELSREVDQELSGRRPDAPTVIPIEGVRGTVASPRVLLDRSALAGIATTLATGGRLGRQLEDKLGPAGAEAVENILDQLLKGRR